MSRLFDVIPAAQDQLSSLHAGSEKLGKIARNSLRIAGAQLRTGMAIAVEHFTCVLATPLVSQALKTLGAMIENISRFRLSVFYLALPRHFGHFACGSAAMSSCCTYRSG